LASRQVSVAPAIMFGPNITANNNVQVSSWPLPNFPEINKAFRHGFDPVPAVKSAKR